MTNRLIAISLVTIMAALSFYSRADAEPPPRLNLLGTFSVGSEERPGVGILSLSPTGDEILVETWDDGDSFNVITLNETKTAAFLTKRSRSNGTWKDGSAIKTAKKRRNQMGLLELNAKGLLRASTEEIESGKVRFEDEIGNVVESRRRMLVRNEVLLGAGPPPKMIPTWVPISEVGPDALKPGYPHPILGVPGVKRLFWIEGQKRIEITTPEFDTVFRFEYDELNRRVCAGTIAEDPKHIIYDVDEGRRRMLPSLDASGAELNYLLIPGKDYLVVRRAKLDESGDNYQEICLKLANLDGEILSDIPLTFEGCGERVDPDPEQIIVSQYLMAVWVTDYQRRRIMVFSLSQD